MKKNIFILAAALYIASAAVYAGSMTIESDKQEFKDGEKKIFLEGNVKVKTEDADITSPRAVIEIDPKTNKVKNAEFKEKAYSWSLKDGKKHEVKAQILNVSLLNKHVSAQGNSIVSIMDKDKPVVIVTADKQEYHKNSSMMQASGSVNIVYKDVTTYSNEAVVYLDENNDVKKIILTGNSKLERDKNKINADKLVYDNIKEDAEAFGNVYSDITTDDDKRLEVWSNYQTYDKKRNFVSASGYTRIKYEDYNASGPKVNVYSSKDTGELNEAVFIGRSKIETNGRTVEADRITITMNPKDFKAEGSVKSTIPNISGGEL